MGQGNRLPVFRDRLMKLMGEESNTGFAKFLGLTRQTLGFYLNGDRIPDAETLKQICTRCNVSSDYLLGLSKHKTPSAKERGICEYTGLSEKAVSNLHAYNNPNNANFSATAHSYTQAIDFLLSHPLIEHLLIPLSNALETAEASRQFDLDESIAAYENMHGKETSGKDYREAEELISACGNVVLPIEDAVQYYSQQAAHVLQAIISDAAAFKGE